MVGLGLTYEQAFSAAYDALGVRRPTYEPRATGHATEMVELMHELVAPGTRTPRTTAAATSTST